MSTVADPRYLYPPLTISIQLLKKKQPVKSKAATEEALKEVKDRQKAKKATQNKASVNIPKNQKFDKGTKGGRR
jgi:hypothetical protein